MRTIKTRSILRFYRGRFNEIVFWVYLPTLTHKTRLKRLKLKVSDFVNVGNWTFQPGGILSRGAFFSYFLGGFLSFSGFSLSFILVILFLFSFSIFRYTSIYEIYTSIDKNYIYEYIDIYEVYRYIRNIYISLCYFLCLFSFVFLYTFFLSFIFPLCSSLKKTKHCG